MTNTDVSPEIDTESSLEISKKNLAQEVYSDRKLGKEIVEKVKWSMDFQKRSGNKIPWSPEAAEDKISGNLRGLVAEAVSDKIPLTDAQNVFTYGDTSLVALKIVSPQEYVGSPTNRKGDVLAHLLRKSFEEKPLRTFDPNIHIEGNPMVEEFKMERLKSGAPRIPAQEYARGLQDYMENERKKIEEDITKGYTYGPVKEKGGTVTPAGEWYDTTVIPDGLILDDMKVPVGAYEVKAYDPNELANMLNLIRKSGKEATHIKANASDFGKTYPGADKEQYSLGVDLNKETEFVDILRGVSGKGVDRDTNNLIILRFPNDIPDNLLTQYGEMIVSYGYRNLIIQKIPFSGEELNVIAKEIVKHQWGNLDLQLLKVNFSNRDIEVFKNWAGVLD